MGEEIKITFETLYDLLRREKGKEELQALEDTFYSDVVSYLSEKIQLLDSRSNDDDLFSMGEKEKLESELRNIKKILKELYEKREKKIIEMALNRSRTGSNIIDTSALLEEEKKFYEQIVTFLDKFRMSILFNMFKGQSPEVKPEKEIKEPETKEEKEETKKPVEESQAEGPDLVKIKFIHAVPRFVGTDLEVHGPFEKDEEAELPNKIADVLVEKGRAKLTENE